MTKSSFKLTDIVSVLYGTDQHKIVCRETEMEISEKEIDANMNKCSKRNINMEKETERQNTSENSTERRTRTTKRKRKSPKRDRSKNAHLGFFKK